MSDDQYGDLFDNEETETPVQEQENGPKALRDALKKQAAELKELREFKVAQEQKARKSEIEKALSAAGLPAEAAKFATGADDIGKWIEENRGLFGVAGTSQAADVDDASPKGEANLSEDAQAEIMALQGVTRSNYDGRDVRQARLAEAEQGATSLSDLISKVNVALKE